MSLFDNYINSRRIENAIHDRRKRDGEFSEERRMEERIRDTMRKNSSQPKKKKMKSNRD